MDFIACFLFCLTSGILLYEFWGYPVLVVILSKIFPKHLNMENFVPHSRKTECETTSDVNTEHFLPMVSILIPAYNEDRVIRQKIENLLALAYPENLLEIVVVSDGSTDLTNEMTNSYSAHEIKVIQLSNRSGKVNLLNRVIPFLKGRYDCIIGFW